MERTRLSTNPNIIPNSYRLYDIGNQVLTCFNGQPDTSETRAFVVIAVEDEIMRWLQVDVTVLLNPAEGILKIDDFIINGFATRNVEGLSNA